MIGRTLGHFRIVEEIGAGGMGVVYRARDERLERDVAIKILPPGALVDDNARKRFRKEALALSRLSHPNIAVIFDFDTQQGTDFLVMELIPGDTLSDKLANGPLPEKEVLRLGAQLAEGLGAAHEQDLLHRDLKPSNLRVTPDGWLKILDFGLAKLLRPIPPESPTESLSDSMQAAGTLPYMAPEQLREEKLDARTDIWAAGAVLYEAVTGKRPFRAPGLGLIDAILHEAPIPPSTVNRRISPGLEGIIVKCLDKDPENRYQSAKELCVDLRRLAGQSVTGAVVPRPRRRRWQTPAKAIAGVLLSAAVAIGLVLGIQGVRRQVSPSPQVRSLAVLPFANLSGDPNQEFFSDGMTDALITELAQISALKVISRTSTMLYKKTAKPLPEIAGELNVDAIVEGSVQRSGTQVGVTVKLIDKSDRQLRAVQLERRLSDVLGLEREMARAIAGEIKISLTPREQQHFATAPQVDPAAHLAYLKGEYLNIGTNEQRRRARDSFAEAIRLDPNYAPAYAGLADYYWAVTELDPQLAMPKAREYAARAVELDPALAHAHKTMASVAFYADWDWPAAEREFRRAIEINPSYEEAHRMYSVFLAAMGRHPEASSEARRARELDPLSPLAQITAGWNAYFARQYADSARLCRAALELDPNSVGAHACLGSAYLAQGMHEQAINEALQASRLSGGEPVRVVGVGRAYALAGNKAEARRVLEDLISLTRRKYVPPYYLAALHAAIGENDEAFTWLEKAYHDRDRYLPWLKVDPMLDPLRSDPRFQKLLSQVGLAQ